MTACYLGLGSNLRTPIRQIHRAMAILRTLPQTYIKKKSRCYISKPCGLRSQPMYCNAVVLVETRLSSHALLRHCQSIETQQGRIRKKHWGSRTIDIDLLLYGQHIIQSNTLTIPHPGLLHRDFVIVPLLNLSPSLILPHGQSLIDALHALTTRYLK